MHENYPMNWRQFTAKSTMLLEKGLIRKTEKRFVITEDGINMLRFWNAFVVSSAGLFQ